MLIALLLNPRNAARLASVTMGNFSLGSAINSLPGLDLNVLYGEPADVSVPIGEGKNLSP
jgi:hypothetical protein